MRAPHGFNVEVQRDGSTIIIAPTGELDLATVGPLRDAFLQADGCREMVIDLRGLSFMDSAGLSLVLEEHHRAEAAGIDFRVVRGSPEVHRLFELTDLVRRLKFTETEPTAAASGEPPDG